MPWSDKQLRAHKKASAGLSVATSTLGIGALGIAGARAGAGKGVRLAQKAGRLKNVTPAHVRNFKAKSTGVQTGLLTSSAGLGGIGGFNYAGIQAAEAKRSARVAKSDSDLDMGLAWVKPGEISKAMSPEERKTKRNNSKVMQEHTQRSGLRGFGAGVAGGAALGAAAVNPRAARSLALSAKYGAKAGKKFYAASKPAPGLKRIGNPSLRTKVGDARSGARQTASRLRSASIGGAQMARGTRETTRGSSVFNRSGNSPYTGVAATGAGLWGGVAGANIGERHGKKKALADPRYIHKAYDPERKRSRRLEHYSTGASTAAGALGAASVGAGLSAKKKALRAVKTTPSGSQYLKLTGLGGKGGAGRGAAVTAALGLGAVGAAVGADRIQRYKRGNGRTYRPLHGQF